MYPIDKYRYFKIERPDGSIKIVAVSTYAGKTVRGVAICDSGDAYDENKGKELAAARCELRVAEKRYKRAGLKVKTVAEQLDNFAAKYGDAQKYYADSARNYAQAESHLMELLDSM